MVDNTSFANLPFHNLDDVEFTNVVKNFSHNFPLSALKEMIYEPLNLTNRSTIDDDFSDNIFHEPDCNYYFCDDQVLNLQSNNLNILSFNINSIPRHFEQFVEQCLMPFDVPFNIIGLCETRLNDNIDAVYKLSGYNGFFNNRSTQGGGLAVYLDTNFSGSYMNEVCLKLPHIETLSLLVSQPHNFVVCLIYRSPKAKIEDFMLTLEHLLESLKI